MWPPPLSNRRKRRAAQRASLRRPGGRVPGGLLGASRRPAVVFTRPARIQRFARDAVRRRRSRDLSTNRHEQHEQASATPLSLLVTPANAGAQGFSGAGRGLECVGVPVTPFRHPRDKGGSGGRVFFKGTASLREGPRTGSGGGAVGEMGIFAGVAHAGFTLRNQYVSRFQVRLTCHLSVLIPDIANPFRISLTKQ